MFSKILGAVLLISSFVQWGDCLATKQDIYKNCSNGELKKCFGFPSDCEKTKDCTAMIGVERNQPDVYHFSLFGPLIKDGGEGYVGFGLNDNAAKMEGSQMFLCIRRNGDNVVLLPAFAKVEQVAPIKQVSGDVLAGPNLRVGLSEDKLVCEWDIKTNMKIDKIMDFNNTDYFFLVSFGPANGVDIQYHASRGVSLEKFSLKELKVVEPAPVLSTQKTTSSAKPMSSPTNDGKITTIDDRISKDTSDTNPNENEPTDHHHQTDDNDLVSFANNLTFSSAAGLLLLFFILSRLFFFI